MSEITAEIEPGEGPSEKLAAALSVDVSSVTIGAAFEPDSKTEAVGLLTMKVSEVTASSEFIQSVNNEECVQVVSSMGLELIW